MGEINTIVSYCKEKLKECVETKDVSNRQAYMEKIVQLGLEKQSLEVVISLLFELFTFRTRARLKQLSVVGDTTLFFNQQEEGDTIRVARSVCQASGNYFKVGDAALFVDSGLTTNVPRK